MAIPKGIIWAGEPTEGYWIALGTFIHSFSAVERMLQMLLRYHAGMTAEVAKSVFSGARGDTCRDFINRICDATGRIETKKRSEPAFTQLGHITTARNAIVHWGASVQPDDTLAAINDFLAHTPERLRRIPVSTEMLGDMTYDLFIINGMIGLEVIEVGAKTEETDTAKASLTASLAESARLRGIMGISGPWLYKPPQPPPPEKGTRARRRERKRQPDASGA